MEGEFKWYALKVVSGQERIVKKNFETELQRLQLEKLVTRVLIPLEKVYKIQAKKKQIKERSFFPGYIFIYADMANNHVLHVLNKIPKILGVVGTIREQEINKVLQKVDEGDTATVDLAQPFVIGEAVNIIDGPFSGFSGSIQKIFEERKKLNVIVRIFERNAPIELNYVQVERVI